jgi:hypothetical protein
MRWLYALILASAIMASASVAAVAQTEDVLRPHGRADGGQKSTMLTPRSKRVVLGLEGGINVNFLGQKITWDTEVANSMEAALESGLGVSPEFGLFADFPISSSVGIQVRAAYDAKAASNTLGDGMLEGGTLPAGRVQGFAPSEGNVEAHYSLSMQAATIAALARIDIAENFFVTFGPVLNLAFGDITREDHLTVKSPDDFFLVVDYNGTPVQEKRDQTRNAGLAEHPAGSWRHRVRSLHLLHNAHRP